MGISADFISETRAQVGSILDRVLRTREELALRERDKRMAAVFEKGHATSAEIYEADFGTKHPNGLDVQSYPAHKNRFRVIGDDDAYRNMPEDDLQSTFNRCAGQAMDGGRIFIHPRYWEPSYRKQNNRSFSSLLAHEHAHVSQFYERDTGWSSSFDDNETRILHLDHDKQGLSGKAKHLYQKFNRAAVDWRAEKITKHKVSDYFSNEVEMQARMHEVLSMGYAGWQKMPTTKTELWAALHNMGVETPGAIRKELKSTEEGKDALRQFRCSNDMRQNVAKVVGDLNRVDDYATFSSVREDLWRDGYPFMYGNLLEHYGDRLGRERMGLGHNPAAAKKVISALKNEPLSLDDEKIKALVSEVHPDNVIELVNRMLPASQNNPIQEGKAVAIINEIMQTEPLRNALLAQEEFSVKKGEAFFPPLYRAIMNGNVPVVEALVKGGVDPFSNIKTRGASGSIVGENNAFNYIRPLTEMEQGLVDSSHLPDNFKAAFNDADKRKDIEERASYLRKSLQAIADAYPAMDEERTVTGDDGFPKKVTARQLLAEAGIKPQGQERTMTERETNENHVAFHTH